MHGQALIVSHSAMPWLDQMVLQVGLVPVNQIDPERAVSWAARYQPSLIVGVDVPALSRAMKLHRATNLIPLLHAGPFCRKSLCVEPDELLPLPLPPESLHRAIERQSNRRAKCEDEGLLATLRLLVPSDPPGLEELSQLLAPWFTSCGLNPYAVQRFNQAVREVVANAIEWGHGNRPERLVAVECRLEEDRVGVLIRDTGPGFDPGNIPHAARPGDPLSHLAVRASRQLREGGFGILMASGMVDHLCYNDTGNEASLIKFLPARRVGRPALARP